MYSEENSPRNHVVLFTIIFLIYMSSILVWQSVIGWIITVFLFSIITYNLGLKLCKELLVIIIALLIIHIFCGKFHIIILLLLLMNGIIIYFMNLSKKDRLHIMAFLIPNQKILYSCLFVFYFEKLMYQQLKYRYYLVSEFDSKLFYRHFIYHIRLSFSQAKRQSKEIENVYRRLYYGYKKKKGMK